MKIVESPMIIRDLGFRASFRNGVPEKVDGATGIMMATRLRAPHGARRGWKVLLSPAVAGNAIPREKMERSDPPRGRPFGGGGVIPNNEDGTEPLYHIGFNQFS